VLYDSERAPLTITDLKMPVMDGLELLRHVRWRGTPADAAVIIAHPGAGDVAVAVESLKQGGERLHPEAGRPRPDPASPPSARSSAAAPDRAPRASRPPRVPGGGSHPRAGRRPSASCSRPTWRPSRPGLGARHPGGGHRAPLPARARLLDRARPGAPPAGGRPRSARAAASSCTTSARSASRMRSSPQARPPHSRGVAGDATDTRKSGAGSSWSGSRSLRNAIPVVYHHHERWDGTGYPLGLAGPAIPLGARIFAVADAFDALTYDRPYSKAIPMEAARERIRIAAGNPLRSRTWWPRSSRWPLEVFEMARARSLEGPTA